MEINKKNSSPSMPTLKESKALLRNLWWSFFWGGHIPWTRGQLRQGFRLITAAPWIKEMIPRENGGVNPLNSQPQTTPYIVGMVWVYPLLKGSLGGLNSLGTIWRIPPFSVWMFDGWESWWLLWLLTLKHGGSFEVWCFFVLLPDLCHQVENWGGFF